MNKGKLILLVAVLAFIFGLFCIDYLEDEHKRDLKHLEKKGRLELEYKSREDKRALLYSFSQRATSCDEVVKYINENLQ